MVEECTSAQIGIGLGDELGAHHCLAIPGGCIVLFVEYC
jgi:hypothetical protein